MDKFWAKDFSYNYLLKLLNAAKSNFFIYKICDSEKAIKNSKNKPQLLLRHDVDVSLDKAFNLAKLEEKIGIKATYMVMINCPLYSLKTRKSKQILSDLIKMGHEVALHFKPDGCDMHDISNFHQIEKEILSACLFLEKIIEREVLSVSFHRPPELLIKGLFKMGNRINAYAKVLMENYLADSRGVWRNGEPLTKLRKPENGLVQLLIHPIWWDTKHKSPQDRLQDFFEQATKGKNNLFVKAFSTKLSLAVPRVQRAGLLK